MKLSFTCFIVFILLISSCALGPTGESLMELGVVYGPNRDVANRVDPRIKDIFTWIYNNIKYQLDIEHFGMYDYWAPRSVILRDKRGDCEDFTNLFLLMVKDATGIKGKFVYVWVEEESSWHAVSLIEGVYFDFQFVISVPWRTTHIVSFLSYDYIAALTDR